MLKINELFIARATNQASIVNFIPATKAAIKALILVFSLLSAFNAKAQADYTGIWNGKFYDNAAFGNPDDTYRFEVQIAQTNKGIEGVTYSYQSTRFYGKAGHNGYVKTDGKKLVIQETRMIELKMDIGVACLMTCTMKYSKVGEDEYLEGTYTAVEENSGRSCPGGYVKLKKIKKSIFGTDPKVQKKLNEIAKRSAKSTAAPSVNTAPVKKAPVPSVPAKPKYIAKAPVTTPPTDIARATPKVAETKPPVVRNPPVARNPQIPTTIKKDTPIASVSKPVINQQSQTEPAKPPVVKPLIPPAPKALLERTTETASTFKVTDTSEFLLKFYDYGEIDGDIVTIYVNNKPVVNKALLSAKAIEVPVKLSEEVPVVEVVMYADNLGSIPPNTAYMTVIIGNKRHEVTIESTEQKSSSVKFVLTK